MKKAIYAANNYLMKIALLLILLMMFVTVADILGRAFIKPIPGVFEMTRYSMAVIIFTALGYSQIHKVHIAIDIVVTRLPILCQRIISVILYLLAVVAFSLCFWQMLIYTKRLIDSGLITTVLRAPVFPFVLISAVGILFFVLVLLTDLIDAVKALKKGGEKP